MAQLPHICWHCPIPDLVQKRDPCYTVGWKPTGKSTRHKGESQVPRQAQQGEGKLKLPKSRSKLVPGWTQVSVHSWALHLQVLVAECYLQHVTSKGQGAKILGAWSLFFLQVWGQRPLGCKLSTVLPCYNSKPGVCPGFIIACFW